MTAFSLKNSRKTGSKNRSDSSDIQSSSLLDGKLKKFVAERTLTEQPYVKDDSKTVGQLLKEASGKLGEAISVRRFARFKIGEA